jgi:hypothetical protein
MLAFLTNMGEKHKSASPSATQVKNQWKTISNEEKLEVISQKVNRLLTCAVMLDLLMVAYEEVIMLIELIWYATQWHIMECA